MPLKDFLIGETGAVNASLHFLNYFSQVIKKKKTSCTVNIFYIKFVSRGFWIITKICIYRGGMGRIR